MRNNIIFIFICLILLSACQHVEKETFYWGNYSSSLYDLKKNPDDKKLEAHKEQLLQIIDVSQKDNYQIPPGVNAEYGYILIKQGKEKEGIEYLNKEIQLYPESAIFIERIKKEYERVNK